jgi:hypothetical protein
MQGIIYVVHYMQGIICSYMKEIASVQYIPLTYLCVGGAADWSGVFVFPTRNRAPAAPARNSTILPSVSERSNSRLFLL